MSTDTRARLYHAINAWAATRSGAHSLALNAVVDSVCIELEMLRREAASQAESLGAAGETIAQLQAQVRDAATPAVLQALEDLTIAYRALAGLDGAWDQPLIRAERVVIAAKAAPQCQCGDRAASACPGQWEPGCDLGANPAHARVVPAQGEPVARPEPCQYLSCRFIGCPAAGCPFDAPAGPSSTCDGQLRVAPKAAPAVAQPEPCRYPSCQFIGCPAAGCYEVAAPAGPSSTARDDQLRAEGGPA